MAIRLGGRIDLSLTRLEAPISAKNPVGPRTPQLHSEGVSDGIVLQLTFGCQLTFQFGMHVQNAMLRQKVEVQLATEKEHGLVGFLVWLRVVGVWTPSFLQLE